MPIDERIWDTSGWLAALSILQCCGHFGLGLSVDEEGTGGRVARLAAAPAGTHRGRTGVQISN